MIDIRLKSGKDRPVRFGHPWIFSGAVANLDPAVEPGSIVRVQAADGSVLGIGYANPRCPIAVRMLSEREETIDDAFVAARVADAHATRQRVVASDTDAYRLINGEGDRLPGVVVDRFADVLVLQCLTAGAERLRPLLIEALVGLCAPRAIFERSDGSVRTAEGLAPRIGIAHGELTAEVAFVENGLRFGGDFAEGQKTGFFLDQRPNRAMLRQLAAGQRVLDAYAYTGGFAIHAAAGAAARIVAVESSTRALDTARDNIVRNTLAADAIELVRHDVPRFLRETSDEFDLLVLDPPALAKHRSDVPRASRAYKDLHLWALRRAAPGALILTFTCSQHVGADLFRKIVLGAAVDARRPLQLLQHLGPGPDHPVGLGHPEGEYLHGLLVRAG